ncbi:uncharacterized protein MELLADRAFT_111511 [Melampsora larici-populina 98AG31]|uniref:Alpha-type protein kinase domain-containing protein n=1 Tax=Melampsora larici-populina (strain 98AG31 / pathotype 3-4-7) TaxID=747676 RepID=F4S3F4_MELLP|nr:uncharacterized protein MELLADRAFT_111511 [Melampsora larici-populina 98AG31]EGG00845.1 hypothetical protein MELLADRAFT_111511 [Melampsora larici-populina 98AG31]
MMRALGRGTLNVTTISRSRISPGWKAGSMLTIITTHPDSPDLDQNILDRLVFEKADIMYYVDRLALIGSGAFMNCYKAKVVIEGQVRDMVAKQGIGASISIESYQALAQRYLQAERCIEMFKLAVQSHRDDIPKDIHDLCQKIRLVKNFIVHRGRSDDPKTADIFLFEEKIEGNFVKFFGNLFFGIPEDKENETIYQIMHTLSHKTYHDSYGRWMIADIQGNKDGLLTDIAIIDEEYPWTMGNTNRLGLIGFCLTAKCNSLCKYLDLPPPRSARYPKLVNGVVVEGTENNFPVLDSDAERSWELEAGIRSICASTHC